jgi:ComF family protein
MLTLKTISRSLGHLFFPHLCYGCHGDIIARHQLLCSRCQARLPHTQFEQYALNPVERIFFGRLPLEAAFSSLYFTQQSLVQQLLHQLKYQDKPELGVYLGRLMAEQMQLSPRFAGLDALVPLPLFPAREKKRGYNQAAALCEGMAEVLSLPILTKAIVRTQHTDTQTRKSRTARWENINGRFELRDAAQLAHKHLLLVDDVVTTGATLEACGQVLLSAEGVKLSIGTLACAGK